MIGSRSYFYSLLNYTNIDPISLGQPFMYYQTFDTSYLTPTSPTLGASITEIRRYNDSAFSATTGDTLCAPSWEDLNSLKMLYFPGDDASCWPPPCTGTCSTYFITNQDISFMSLSGYQYTIYLVAKPLSGSTTFINFGGGILGNYPSGTPAQNYDLLYVKNNKDIYLTTTFGGFVDTILDLPIETNVDSTQLESKNLRVFSVRANDTFNTTTTAATAYVNGVLTTGITQQNVSTDTSLYGNPTHIGTTPTDGPNFESYQGYIAELIIFKTYHNETIHKGIVDFLKNRWNIT